MTGAIAFDIGDERREQLTRAILESPAEQSNKIIADRVGISPEAVRKIRCGMMYASFCVDLERLERNKRSTGGKTCRQCVHWERTQRIRVEDPMGEDRDIRRVGYCGLDFPEAENVRYGCACPAFARARP